MEGCAEAKPRVYHRTLRAGSSVLPGLSHRNTAETRTTMPSRTTPEPARYDATVQPNVKNVFAREPVLIPQLFEKRLRPWYRRRSGRMVVALLFVGVGVAAVRYRATLLRALADIVGG